MSKMEVLAPAGSLDILKAVIEAGADAVYLGGPAFGARAYANNFTQEELIYALDYAHMRGRKIFMTVNTLLKNQELSRLIDFLQPYYEAGLDAVLVQDWGVLKMIHESFPDLPIHTSTQMTVTGADGVRVLQKYGVKRVVMAREVSLAEMKKIHDETGMEIEAFVHGALCYSYSGQCLFSSLLGGRSGNRGRCAQPCRLPYQVLDSKRKPLTDETYILSLKDMCGLGDLQSLYEHGVYSLKIEGRMKSAAYAAGVVSLYRKYVDMIENNIVLKVSDQDMKTLRDLGSRGFTDKYYFSHNGKEMVTFKKPSFESRENPYQQVVEERFVKEQKKLPISGYILLHRDEPAYMCVTRGEITAEAVGGVPMEAQNVPLSEESLAARLRKTGDTPFVFEDLTIDLEDGLFVPNGALNALRREALEKLAVLAAAPYHRTVPSAEPMQEASACSNQAVYSCSCRTAEQLEAALSSDAIDLIYLESSLFGAEHYLENASAYVEQAHKNGKQLYLALPVIFRDAARRAFDAKAEALACCDGFLVRNLEEIGWLRRNCPDKPFVTDHNLYCFNDAAQKAFRGEGALRTTVPLELNRSEILHRDNDASEMLLYGRYPLMTTAGCVHKNTAGCDRKPQLVYLKDRYKTLFPVYNDCSECINTIYNSLPTELFAYHGELKKAGITSFRLSFTTEGKAESSMLLRDLAMVKRGQYVPMEKERSGKYTNGHYKRGVE